LSEVAERTDLPWTEFVTAVPELASRGRELFERFGFVFLGTIRPDGTPRISPVEVHIVNGHLMLVMIAGSRKVQDVLRDPRVTLQTPITDAADPGAEFKVHGRLVEVVEAAQRTATADAIEAASGWRPSESWSFFSVRVEAAAHLAWAEGEMVLVRWDHDRGLRPAERRRLDFEAAAYREV